MQILGHRRAIAAAETLEVVLFADPTSAKARFRAAEATLRQGRENALSIHPSKIPPCSCTSDTRSLRLHTKHHRLRFRLQRYEEARTLLQPLLDPPVPEASQNALECSASLQSEGQFSFRGDAYCVRPGSHNAD